MLRKKIRKSLTARIFLITVLVLLGAGTITFGLIAWATPSSYRAVIDADLTRQVQALTETLQDVPLADCGPALEDFVREAGADVTLAAPDGELVFSNVQLAGEALAEDAAATDETEATIAVTTAEQATLTAEVFFSDQARSYTLYVTPRLEAENVAVRALIQMAPWVLLTLLLFSLLGAFVYSRYITRPIVQMSDIAGKMADMDFDWKCQETREDEIGHLGRSLNQMAAKLSRALEALKASNAALRGEVEQERALDLQRRAFFAAASHELKTPVTILRGHLSGLLDGIGIYQDQEKYLARSLQTTARMEHLIQEILMVSRMEARDSALPLERLDLSAITEEQLALAADLLEPKKICVSLLISLPALMLDGERAMLAKAIGKSACQRPRSIRPLRRKHPHLVRNEDDAPTLIIENTGVHIGEDALPHLFDAFYREERSRNRQTGGSGLGLYLVRIILERHGASCAIDNTAAGVRATVRICPDDTQDAHLMHAGVRFFI